MKINNRYYAIIALSALVGCGDAATYKSELGPEAEAAASTASTPVNEVLVTSESTIGNKQLTVVGPVSANITKATALHPNPTVEQAEQKLRIEAAELGADAVIDAVISEVKVCLLSWGCREATGTAVSFE